VPGIATGDVLDLATIAHLCVDGTGMPEFVL